MLRRSAVALSFFLALNVPAFAQVTGTAHDLSANEPTSQVCIFCHTPHNAEPAVPLWNHELSSATYTEYTSPTMDATPVGPLGGGTGISNLCLSCHDGTVGLGSLVNNGPGGPPINQNVVLTGNADLGTDLSNDHPINIYYDADLVALDDELIDPTMIDVDLFGPNGDELQCASCHDAHDDTIEPFLVKSNNGSELCLTCHVK